MKIAILGAGAMGMLYGGYLSKKNDVTLIARTKEKADKIEKDGVRIKEKDGSIGHYTPHAAAHSSSLGEMDLVIVFVKALDTIPALESNKGLIGKNTYLMTLQNGAGHESKLLQFSDKRRIIIGSSQHNSSLLEPGFILHGGSGITSVGLLEGNNEDLSEIVKTFRECNLACKTEENILRQIWKKLFINTAASSLTAILQVPLGFIHSDRYANFLMRKLAEEAVTAASSLSLDFSLDEVINDIENVLISSGGGYTSIYSDIKNGRKSEVDTISGSVIEAARLHNISVPYHEMAVSLIHALEDRNGDGNG